MEFKLNLDLNTSDGVQAEQKCGIHQQAYRKLPNKHTHRSRHYAKTDKSDVHENTGIASSKPAYDMNIQPTAPTIPNDP
jgi:hypothetical protein